MGRLKIKQEDNSKEVVAYLSDVQPIATDLDNLIDDVEDVSGVGRTTETIKKNADDISNLAGTGRTTETVKNNADKIGVLNSLTTTEKSNLTGAVSEVKNEIVQHKLDYVEQVKVPIKNIINNGDFSKGMIKWYSLNAVVGGIAEFTSPSQYSSAYQEIPNHINYRGHILYACGEVKATSNLVSFGITDGYVSSSASHTGDNTFKKFSIIKKVESVSSLLRVRVVDSRSSGWDKIYIDNILVIDLTSAFGEGNEPTKGEMDVLIGLLGGWFDGAITPTQKQLLNWQLKLIRQNRNAIISLGGTIV